MVKRTSKKKATRKKATSKKRSKKKAVRSRKPDPMKPGPERKFTMPLGEIEKLAKLQCTHTELAGWFGCGREAVTYRLNTDPKARAAWDKGRAAGTISLRRKIWQRATGRKGDPSLLRHLANNYAGLSEQSTHRHAGHDGGALPVGGGGLTTAQVEDIKTKILGIPPEKDD